MEPQPINKQKCSENNIMPPGCILLEKTVAPIVILYNNVSELTNGRAGICELIFKPVHHSSVYSSEQW